jgi:hypothetical protein
MFLKDLQPRVVVHDPRRRGRLGQAPMPTVEELGAVYAAATGQTLTAFQVGGPIGAPTTSYTAYLMFGEPGAWASQATSLDATQMAPYIAQWQAAHPAPAPTILPPLPASPVAPVVPVVAPPPAPPAPPAGYVMPAQPAIPLPAAAAGTVSSAEFNAYVQAQLVRQQATGAATPAGVQTVPAMAWYQNPLVLVGGGLAVLVLLMMKKG